jgi:hypothetical protein
MLILTRSYIIFESRNVIFFGNNNQNNSLSDFVYLLTAVTVFLKNSDL